MVAESDGGDMRISMLGDGGAKSTEPASDATPGARVELSVQQPQVGVHFGNSLYSPASVCMFK